MKKILSLIFSFVMCFMISVPALASSSSSNLESMASSLIEISETTDTNGSVTITYTNLDTFIETARLTHPELSDLEIAKFLLDYIGQEYNDLPDSEILHFLTYTNITSSTSFIRIDQDGHTYVSSTDYVPYADWTSTDGYMQITTEYSHVNTIGNEKYYAIWARAKWINFPAIAMQDAFVLGTSGTFDDSYSEYASVQQAFSCVTGCQLDTYRNRTVTATSPVDFDLTLEYANYLPVIRFVPIAPRCDYCSGPGRDEYFTAFLRYGIIADESVNIQAAYGHKTFGLGDISIGFDIAGTPSFSSGISITVEEYIARPVTVHY